VAGVPANPYPAKIINMSIGGTGSCPQSYQDAISQITARGVLIVASAGNEGGPVDAPGNCPGVAAIGGLRQAGTKVGFSNVGAEIALSSPAGNCVNTGAGQPCLYALQTTSNLGTTTPGQNSYTDQINSPNLGTSFSAPIVSGIAALMVAANANLTSYQLIARLERSSTPFPQTSAGETTQPPMCHEPSSSSDDSQASECICTNPNPSASPPVPSTCGAGMANASAALTAALDPIAAINVPAIFSAGSTVTLDATGSAAACNHTLATYQWVSSDPANHPVTNASSSKASVVAPASGSFVVTLTITDDAGRQDTGTVTVSAGSATTTVPGSAGSTACPTPITVVSVTPNGPSVEAGAGTISFAASVGDAGSNVVNWQVNGTTGGNATVGTISSTGLYTAPATQPSPDTITVSAVSVADPTRSGWTQVTITPAVVSVAVSPASATVNTGATQAFTAKVTGSSNTAVTWQVNGATGGNATAGTITSSGVYTAPAAVPSPAVVTVTAVSVAAPTDSGSASVTITAPPSTGSGGSGGGSTGSGTGSTASPATGGKSGGGALDWISLLAFSMVLTLRSHHRRLHTA
jgi:serine protease